MENIVALLILAAIIILIAALIGVRLWMKFDNHRTSIYERRLAAESQFDRAILSAAKVITVGRWVYLTTGVDNNGRILFDRVPVTDKPAAPIGQTAADEDHTVHDDAVTLVSATLHTISDKRKPGQIMTADEAQAAGLFTGRSDPPRDVWQAAVNHLCSLYNVETESKAGRGKNGVFYRGHQTKDGLDLNLQYLLSDMALKRPTYPAQMPPQTVKAGM